MINLKNKKIMFSGGGTGGSVAPLLAIYDDLALSGADFFWVGTKRGVEKEMVKKYKIKYFFIQSGKLRRYFSFRNFVDPFCFLIGFFQAFIILLKIKPDIIISAGSFVSVGVAWAGRLLKIPILVHQQDVRPGLANKLMSPFSNVVTVTFEKSLKDYKKSIWTGNPVRKDFRVINYTTDDIRKEFKLVNDLPVVFFLGGGTGSLAINNLVWGNIGGLSKKYQIIHLTGVGKNDEEYNKNNNYHQFDFLSVNKIKMAYEVSSVVVSRCGLGVLTELSYLGKPSILIPMPDSHQEDNALEYFEKNAAVVFDQNEITSSKLLEKIDLLVDNYDIRKKYRNNIKGVIKKGANEKIINIINSLIIKRSSSKDD